MKRVLLLAVVLLALSASEAQAHTTIVCAVACSYPYQRWVDEAKVPTPEGILEMVENTEGCTDPALACTDGYTVWTDGLGGRWTFWHELGHDFALQNPQLAAFSDERFADSYALCAGHWRVDPTWVFGVGEGTIRGSRLNALCLRIRET